MMERPDGSRRFRHLFLDAEGTLYVPKGSRSTWEFWADPSPGHATRFFELDRGVVEALEVLREGSETLCIASRNAEPVLDVLLDGFGIRGLFDEVLLNGDKGRRIRDYLARNGLDRRDALMVGDTPLLDIYPVMKAGVEAILVDRPYNRWADAERIKGIAELPSWLRIADLVDSPEVRARNATLDDFLGPPVQGTKRLIATTDG